MGVIEIAVSMLGSGQSGPIVTLLCDSGERYASTYFDPQWRKNCGLELTTEIELIEHFYETGEWQPTCKMHATAESIA